MRGPHPHLALVELGRVAAEVLNEPGPARIAASFRRSFYLENCRGGLVCIGGSEIGRGPLNALTGAEAAVPAPPPRPLSPGPACSGAGGAGGGTALCEGVSDPPPRVPDRGCHGPAPPTGDAVRPATAARFPPSPGRGASGYGGHGEQEADWWPVVRPGDRAAISPEGIVFAGGWLLTFRGAALREPAPPPPPVSCPSVLREALAALRRWADARNGSDRGFVLPAVLGFGFGTGAGAGIGSGAAGGTAVGGDERASGRASPEAVVAARHLRRGGRAMADWLAAGWGGPRPPSEAPPREAAALIGLGPGLTPAGDDFIGGALLALHALGRTRLAERLGSWVLAESPGRTGVVSHAHLRAAARGMGAEPIHRALHSLLTPSAPGLDPALDDAAAIGHGSGLDTLAGVAAVLDLAARRFPSAPSP